MSLDSFYRNHIVKKIDEIEMAGFSYSFVNDRGRLLFLTPYTKPKNKGAYILFSRGQTS